MRVIAVGLSGFIVFWMLCNLTQLALLGVERIDLYPAPTLAAWYFRWLLTMATAVVLASVPTVLLMALFWRILPRPRSQL